MNNFKMNNFKMNNFKMNNFRMNNFRMNKKNCNSCDNTDNTNNNSINYSTKPIDMSQIISTHTTTTNITMYNNTLNKINPNISIEIFSKNIGCGNC
jgi:hypothetical protein